ncbi:hypothetical protein M406DRAFT_356084 [Cryphonectria parasitica EP155]|uniref:Uncharacterized protein n=1 Tax=Cryphonectria parasitica (strain ATCC 38755 / EP155) TaxID=660469 RepID=A0A9P4Y3S8_CRYP1|nr:uncharacterized protein M406DRAFT_356084 [Cryphonectria parasitica EP155]KAF3765852.1 hypothetical protein M406DRAFT_356084 [Cryphonectria parasitica EP155]
MFFLPQFLFLSFSLFQRLRHTHYMLVLIFSPRPSSRVSRFAELAGDGDAGSRRLGVSAKQ